MYCLFSPRILKANKLGPVISPPNFDSRICSSNCYVIKFVSTVSHAFDGRWMELHELTYTHFRFVIFLWYVLHLLDFFTLHFLSAHWIEWHLLHFFDGLALLHDLSFFNGFLYLHLFVQLLYLFHFNTQIRF